MTSGRWCACLQALQDKFFKELFRDCVSYAGAVIIRRILGIAHVVDYESIKDTDERWGMLPQCLAGMYFTMLAAKVRESLWANLVLHTSRLCSTQCLYSCAGLLLRGCPLRWRGAF